jgi:hypothetical protein
MSNAHGADSDNVPTPNSSSGRANPTPLDAVFIVGSAVTLLLFLLWILYGGGQQFSNAPPFLLDMVKSTTAKLSLAGGSAGALLLRKFVDKSPAPNYLIWIPSFMGVLIVGLFVLGKVMPAASIQTSVNAIRANVSMSLDRQLDEFVPLRKKYNLPDFSLWESSPSPGVDPHGVYYNPSVDPNYPYRDTLSIKQDQKTMAYVKLNPAASDTTGSDLKYNYSICLNPAAAWFGHADNARIMLDCVKEVCSPAKNADHQYLAACDANARNTDGLIPVAYADEKNDATRERGWDVPTVQTLQSMTDRERVGYTLFDVSFTPEGKTAEADRYYFALRVNDQPIYIGGLSPGLTKEQLHQGVPNHISFGLENLNFTGEYDGYEKLALRVYFLKQDTVLYYQDLNREYIALRDAAPIAPLQTAAGTFQWTGKYIKPMNENKYEILLSSADCGDPPQKQCVDRAVNAKRQFDKMGMKMDDKGVVMVVRPPLRKPPAFGLALGVVQPTSQVQFTFNAAEAHQLCSWALGQTDQNRMRYLIKKDLRIYEVATRGYSPCS